MAELNGRKYSEWREYINDKFSVSEFDIYEDEDNSPTSVITVRSKDPLSETKIIFDFPASGLCRVSFYNLDSPLHNAANDNERRRSLMYSDYELTNENLMQTNEYLEIPLHYGWTEKATYYKGRLISVNILYYDGLHWQTLFVEQNISWLDKAGCLVTVLTWPILYVQHRMIQRRINSDAGNINLTISQILPMKQRKRSQ